MVLDSGCSRSVGGSFWHNYFLDTSPENENPIIKVKGGCNKFNLGNGNNLTSKFRAYFPCSIRKVQCKATTDIDL